MTSPQHRSRLTISASPPPLGGAVEFMSADALAAQTRLLRSVIDALPEGVVIAGRSGALIYSNVAAQRIVGFDSGPMPGPDWMLTAGCHRPDGVTPFPLDELPIVRALRGSACENVELFLRNDARPQGTWINASAGPCFDPNGVIIGAIAVFRDVTEARRSADLVGRLTTAVESTSDSVVMTDANGVIVFVNPAFERTTGYSRDEAIGATPRILKSHRQNRRFYEAMWRTIRSGQVFRDVLINRRKDGTEFYAEQTITPIPGPDGSPSNFVSLMRDITERRRAVQQETELKLARDVQQRLYPHASIHTCGYDLSGVMHAAEMEMVSGDYFDVFAMADGSTGIALGDVCGHGMGAALIMAQTRAYVRAFAATDTDVSCIMTKINEALVADLATENFVTLFIGRLDPAAASFTYANAGHLAGNILDRRGRLRTILPSTGPPLGFFASREYEPQPPVRLEPGEMLLLFTDGIVESESPDEEEFGIDRALAVVAANRELPAAELAETLYDHVRHFSDNAPQIDDMTVFVCKAER